MAAKKRTSTKKSNTRSRSASNRREQSDFAQHQVWAVILFAVALLLACILLIPSSGSALWGWLRDYILRSLFGVGAYIVPVAVGTAAVLTALGRPLSSIRFWQICGMLTLGMTLVYIFGFGDADLADGNNFFQAFGRCFAGSTLERVFIPGVWGMLLGYPLHFLFRTPGAHIVIILLLFVGLMLMTRTSIMKLFKTAYKPVKPLADSAMEMASNVRTSMEERRKSRASSIDVNLGDGYLDPSIDIALDEDMDVPETAKPKRRRSKLEAFAEAAENLAADAPEGDESITLTADGMSIEETTDIFAEPKMESSATAAEETASEGEFVPPAEVETAPEHTYRLPPLSLLDEAKGGNSFSKEDTQRNGETLVRTLNDFGVSTKLVGITTSASITRYELEPSPGVKISRITGLSEDLALRLSISGVRIAPIEGKAAVGVEVPNKNRASVTLREVLDTPTFARSKSELTVALGKDVDGNIVCADLQKMPHLLIAGTTGSGKSVCTNTMIQSILFHSRPDEVKMILIDPKRGVEFGVYNGIPHLLVPVVDDPRKAAGALGWAVNEMNDRYKRFAEYNVQKLKGYNDAIRQEGGQPLPLILIIIDELAELMMLAAKEVENSIIHLAQMGRAAGIHMVLATQRPSADVITGLIRANIPSRLALTVANGMESRIIMDATGAEKLLGNGDMLFTPIGSPKALRVQGCFVSDREVAKVTGFIRENEQTQSYDQSIMDQIEKEANDAMSKHKTDAGDVEGALDDDADNEEFHRAVEVVMEAGQASTSMLQRRLRVGYAHAGRLIDEMENRGIIGPHEGSKPRTVLMTRAQWQEMCLRRED